MSIETTLAQNEARERDRQWRVHKRDCSTCGARNHKRCRVGMALSAAADSARARARAQAEQDRQPSDGQLPLFDGAEWR